jgi:hypothetical protein
MRLLPILLISLVSLEGLCQSKSVKNRLSLNDQISIGVGYFNGPRIGVNQIFANNGLATFGNETTYGQIQYQIELFKDVYFISNFLGLWQTTQDNSQERLISYGTGLGWELMPQSSSWSIRPYYLATLRQYFYTLSLPSNVSANLNGILRSVPSSVSFDYQAWQGSSGIQIARTLDLNLQSHIKIGLDFNYSVDFNQESISYNDSKIPGVEDLDLSRDALRVGLFFGVQL